VPDPRAYRSRFHYRRSGHLRHGKFDRSQILDFTNAQEAIHENHDRITLGHFDPLSSNLAGADAPIGEKPLVEEKTKSQQDLASPEPTIPLGKISTQGL